MRHKDACQCSIGAYAFYLLLRFHLSREMDDEFRPNFAKNEEWFDIKILTDGTRDNKKEMGRKSFTGMIRAILLALLIVSAHFGHFGRVNAPVALDFAEIDPEAIRILGK